VPTSTGPDPSLAAGSASAERSRARILGAPVDVVDLPVAVDRLVRLIDEHRSGGGGFPAIIVTLNPEMVMLARRNPEFAHVLDGAALLVPDGIGVVRALRRRGHAQQARVGGVELLDAYLPVAGRRGHRIALAGGGPGVAARAATTLQRRYSGLRVVAAEGGAPDAQLAQRLRAAAPDVVCAAFGHGRQELFLRDHLSEIGAAAGIGVGGWLDYVAGSVRRAPEAVQRAGLEWAWRLGVQPWRVRRQLVLPVFWLRERREARLLHRIRGAG
jgi:N-acetylglucosaminyldiphosphoundecaprenol N-acetyl-beta-D-mannosaminyltransferase